ncbi:MAG: glycosyltransferase [Rudaea sp.]
MNVLFIGKRFYTNRDALRERFGRIYQLPWHWAQADVRTRLWLIDYYTRETARVRDSALEVISTPAASWSSLRKLCAEAFTQQKSGNKAQVVVASGDCYLGLMAYRLAKRLRVRFVFDVYDKYDEFSSYHSLLGFDPFTFLLQHSDTRLFASRALMDRVGCRVERDLVVPNGVDVQRFRPLDMCESRRALGLPEDMTFVGYFGSMEPERGVDDLIAAVRLVHDEGMPIELLLGGKLRPDLDLHQPCVRYMGNVPFDRMPAMLASCDLLSVPYRRSGLMDAGASNKIAEAMACGRPIVATRTPNFMANFPEQAMELDDLLATPGDAVDIARTIRAQLARRVLVSLPNGMEWSAIASALAVELSFSDRPASSVGA